MKEVRLVDMTTEQSSQESVPESCKIQYIFSHPAMEIIPLSCIESQKPTRLPNNGPKYDAPSHAAPISPPYKGSRSTTQRDRDVRESGEHGC